MNIDRATQGTFKVILGFLRAPAQRQWRARRVPACVRAAPAIAAGGGGGLRPCQRRLDGCLGPRDPVIERELPVAQRVDVEPEGIVLLVRELQARILQGRDHLVLVQQTCTGPGMTADITALVRQVVARTRIDSVCASTCTWRAMAES